MWVTAAWLAAPGLVLAGADAARSAYAAISGVVLNDATGAPLRRAVLTLSTLDEPPLEAVTLSESNGDFGFTAIPPGRYRLTALLDGFQQGWFGASTPARPPGMLTLAAGDVRYGITFRLRPLGSIGGTVLDPDGEALPNAQMRLLKAGWSRRKPTYLTRAFTNSDSRGRYRFSSVTPGQYIVMAGQPYVSPVLIQPDAAVGQDPAPKVYAVQFYADAGRLTAATPVQVGPGKDLDGIDFHLAARAAAPLRGRVVAPVEPPARTPAIVSAYPQDLADGEEQSVAMGTFGPNFDFEIGRLAAGAYVIEAEMQAGGRDYRDAQRVELPPGGEEITLHLERAVDLTGRVDLEGGGHPLAFKVSLTPAGFPPGRRAVEAETQPDGTLLAPNVAPGIWDIDVSPIPKGGYIKAMRLGGRDVLTEDMTIDAGTQEPLHIVISPRGGVVFGTVKVPEGVARSARARVLLAPSGKYAHVLSFYAEGIADDSGHFEFQGVTPGRYKVYAFEEMEPGAWADPEFVRPFEKSSGAFEVAEGARVERQTQLILVGTRPAEKD